MAKKSAGILLFRRTGKETEVFLMHPGGPFWAKKDAGAWSIPKGEINEDESEQEAAMREFKEETGSEVMGTMIPLKTIRQKSGKFVVAWAVEQDMEPNAIVSNLFEMEWPPKSGKFQQYPEMDRAAWYTLLEAREIMMPGQEELVIELGEILK